MSCKAVVLAGGHGTRLYPATRATSKQLLLVYDKPLIYYPLCTLLLAGLREFLIISTPHDIPRYEELLGDGERLGISIRYAEQREPRGLADALIIGRDFMGPDRVALALGDNLLWGQSLVPLLEEAASFQTGATIFCQPVKDPQRFAVAELDGQGCLVSLEEKPANPKSNFAVPGLYFYDHTAPEIAKQLRPSARGELEINDVNLAYQQRDQLRVRRLPPDCIWHDVGTFDAMLEASILVQQMQQGQKIMIGSIEEAAYRRGLISARQLELLASELPNEYGSYLRQLAHTSPRQQP